MKRSETTVFIGLDGGGSSTKGIIVSADGEIISRSSGGPSNPNRIDKSELKYNLDLLIRELLNNAGKKHPDAAVFSGGFAGAGTNTGKSILYSAVKEILPNADILILKDIEAAFFGSFPKEQGIVINSGTGSIAMGRNHNNEETIIGGKGYLLGDEGSGYYIGLEALRNVFQKYDDGEVSSLSRIILEHYDVGTLEEIISILYSWNSSHERVITLAEVIIKNAETGNQECLEILDKTTVELQLLITRIIKRLKIMDLPIKISMTGSILKAGGYISNKLKDEIGEIGKFVESQYPPESGALLYYMINKNKNPDEKFFQNLKRTGERS